MNKTCGNLKWSQGYGFRIDVYSEWI